MTIVELTTVFPLKTWLEQKLKHVLSEIYLPKIGCTLGVYSHSKIAGFYHSYCMLITGESDVKETPGDLLLCYQTAR